MLVVLPVVLWNADHQWFMIRKSSAPIPWTHLGSAGLSILAYTAGQLVYYGPVAAGLLLLALPARAPSARHGGAPVALAARARPPLLRGHRPVGLPGNSQTHRPAS